MGVAYDMVAGKAVNPSTTFTALTLATGDTLAVRNFNPPAQARLEMIARQGAAAGAVRVRSPLLHDNVQGIKFTTNEAVASFLLPREIGQPLQAQDTLIAEITGGAAETDAAALGIYYSDLPGAAARLRNWADIAGLIANYKPILVATTTNATAGVWTDTAINTTESLLEANTDYAVLGYLVDASVLAVAVKGPDTSNLRCGGPGVAQSMDLTDYFVWMANLHGTPHIPIINAANVGATFVSVVAVATGATVNVTLVCAQLSQRV